MVDILTRNQS